MSEAGDFIDAALRYEASADRAEAERSRTGELEFYGSSVGAVRGTVRNAARRYPGMTHDEITALASELWSGPEPWSTPVHERRLAAIVLLQSNVGLLRNNDLTRIEGFLRSAQSAQLVDQLVSDVLRPLLATLGAPARARARVVLDRWALDDDGALRRASAALD
ncbi:MAG: DNA alkylation repair protein [Galbitalea sp.]